MNDFLILTLIVSFMVAVAIAAPIWGVDSCDGIESDEAARRVTWLSHRK